ncbi:hypothetical protein BSKO_04386 [Bryopsis sp. KO-2023]|nr:hypothetical protein BSKO_04386 [Bryopsis sp. KO-2023]
MADATKFILPVDSEHKATYFRPWNFRGVHMTSFHASWLAFFTTFVSTFAPAALLPLIRDDLNLTKPDLGNAGIAAVTGTIGARIVMGAVCDKFGPRFGYAVLLLLSAPAVFCMSLVTGPTGFILARFFIGFSLATFVACQFWCSVMFNVKIVGVANATAGGWGNLGGGVTQLLMPLVYSLINTNEEPFTAWRWAFFVPGSMHIIMGAFILGYAQDLPDGRYAALKKTGQMAKASGGASFLAGAKNYRTWLLLALYGFSFGVELTMNNIVASYFFDQFGVSLRVAGVLASMFGLMNLFARSVGGIVSDNMGRKYGMRGRLWSLWILQTVEGVLCVIMGLLSSNLAGTMVAMISFSLFVQSSEGATFGVVPFVSKRGLGIVSGFVGAGGNAGSAITQQIFFKSDKYEVYEGITFLGIMIICMTLLVIPIYFPMWGGMFFGPKEGVTEEDYYLGEYTQEEISMGLANASIKFAAESKSQRGSARLQNETSAKEGVEMKAGTT